MISGTEAQPLQAPQKLDPPPPTTTTAHKSLKIGVAGREMDVSWVWRMFNNVDKTTREKYHAKRLTISSKYSLTLRRDMGI